MTAESNELATGQDSEKEPQIQFAWHYIPLAPQQLSEARQNLIDSGKFRPVEEALVLAVTELGGNFFKHENAQPGQLHAYRYESPKGNPVCFRLEVIVPPLPATEREFQKMFWSADQARAYFLMSRKYGGLDLFGNDSGDKDRVSEGGRGSLMVHLDADECGFIPYVDEEGEPIIDEVISSDCFSKIWLEYKVEPPTQTTDSLPEL